MRIKASLMSQLVMMAVVVSSAVLPMGAQGSQLKARLMDPNSLPRNDVGSEGGASGLRMEMIYEAGLAIGLRAGSSEQSAIIIDGLNRRKADLDRLYKFNYLFTGSGVFIPPVIEEARDVLSTDGRVMRIASRIYRIVKPGRLAFNGPGWEDYLFVGLDPTPPPNPSSAVLPKSEEEVKVWNRGVAEGWDEGVQQTNAVFDLNMARLNKEFTGIMLYNSLKERGLITSEVVAQDQTTVRGDENEMVVNERVLQITQDPGLVVDQKKWVPIIKNSGKQ